VTDEVIDRTAVALLALYLLFLAVIVLAPSSDIPDAAVDRVYRTLTGVGAPHWLTPQLLGFVANVVLFLPLTFLGSFVRRHWSWLVWTALAGVVSAGVEVAQFLFLAGRNPSLVDVVANTLGGALGALLAGVFRPMLRRHNS